MEWLAGLIFEFFCETILQIVLEVLAEFGLRSFSGDDQRAPNPWFAALGYTVFGAIVGGLSLLVFPALLIPDRIVQFANLFFTPLVAGAVMSLMGAWRRERGDEVMPLDRFSYGYLFALAMALVRYTFAQR